ncbi:MAG: ATP-dependent helicase HrpB, partial [Bacteroidota bacterium]|nr:ATP-dependent helicase HrpB [Bacteroidota bacterium]
FMIAEITARTIVKAVREKEGDALVFLPGEGEIRKCEEILKKDLRGFAIHPLYGMLPQGKQYSSIMPDRRGKRKIVLATSIAETSLTIEGIKIVVDSGFGRTSKFDPKSGLSRLETVQISKDSADQRAGRAGRLSPGCCYRMWTRATHERLAEHRTPEIMEADLASLTLDMAQWGISNIEELTWLTIPPKASLSEASETLHQLEALDSGKITEHGKKLHALPCHPRIAHMLLMAKDEDLLALACDIAAILEERDPLPKDSGIDINLRIEALRRAREGNRLGKKMGRIEKVASSYRKLFNIEAENLPVDPFETGFLIVFAYPGRIACARPGNNAQFQLSNGKYAMAGHKDDLAFEAWLAVAHLDARDGTGKIFLASPLNPQDLAPLVKEKEIVSWDSRKGGIVANKELRIGNIVLQSKPLSSPNQEKIQKAISEAVRKEGESLLCFDEEVSQWQNRVMSLRKWRPEENWPDVSTSVLLQNNQNWLGPYLDKIRKPEDLKKLDLTKILQNHLDWEKQNALDKLAPQRIKVPSGSNIKLKYLLNGDPPILAVRLQEVFGLSDTPKINDGRNPVILHLLSPGFKPVQVTSDLRSFWENTYFEVKKEMKRRYPKHAWPENPWEEEAVRGARRF